MFEAFSVGVRLSLLAGGVTSGLMLLSRNFNKVHGDVDGLQRKLDKIGRTALIGSAVTGAGLGIFGLIGKTLPAAREYANQLSILNQLGMKQADVAAAVGAAWKTTYAVPTTTAAANLKTYMELRSTLGPSSFQEGEARNLLPVVQRAAAILEAVTGKKQDHVGFDIVKASELRTQGVMTQEAITRNAELMSRTILAFRGTVNAADFHSTLKMSKGASMLWSDAFTFEVLPTLMQELKTAGGAGGQSAGTYLATLSRQVHGRVQKSALPMWEAMGLIRPSDVVKTGTGALQLKPGAMKGLGLFEQDPYLWVQQVLKPAVDQQAKKTKLSPATIIESLFSDRNAAFTAKTFYMKATQFERDRQLVKQANGMEAYNALLKTNPDLAFMALQNQWQNLMATLGFSIMPDLLAATQALIPQIQAVTQYFQANPNAAKNFMRGLTLIATGLTAVGALMIGSAAVQALGILFKAARFLPMLGSGLALLIGPMGAIARLAVAALGPAIAAIAAGFSALTLPVVLIAAAVVAVGVAIWAAVKHWDASKSILWNIKHEFSMFFTWLWEKTRAFLNLIPGIHIGEPPAPSAPHGWQGPPRAAQHGWDGPSRFVAPGHGASHVQVQTAVHLDGKKVADVVSKHQARAIGPTAIGSGRFDPAASLPAAAAGFNR